MAGLAAPETFEIAATPCGSAAQGPQEGTQTEKSAAADVFMAVNASTVELVDLERYVKEVVGDRPLVAFNLELDTLRADLGTTTNTFQTLVNTPRAAQIHTPRRLGTIT